MVKVCNALRYLFTDKAHFFDSLILKLGGWLPDIVYLKLRYRCKMGYWPNLKDPKTFSEKLQWLKLYNRKPEYTTMVDKYAVKEYVSSRIGEQYIIPTIGVWDTPDEIEWDRLPNQFVLKTTHGGGGDVVICQDKLKLNIKAAKLKLKKSLNSDIYKECREWPYKDVRKRIIAEQYMSDGGRDLDDFEAYNSHEVSKVILSCENGLKDYKFYCFHGVPKLVMVATGRFEGDTRFDYFDMDWNKLSLVWDRPNSDVEIPVPPCFEEMKRICCELCKNVPHLRCDLYVINGKPYFGELTFFDASGFCKFEDEDWNRKLGDLIVLSDNHSN